jgi:hypothetical protein
VGRVNRRIMFQLEHKKQDSIQKITKAKKAKDLAQGVEYLLSKCKALNSNSGTTKTNKHRG